MPDKSGEAADKSDLYKISGFPDLIVKIHQDVWIEMFNNIISIPYLHDCRNKVEAWPMWGDRWQSTSPPVQ